MAGLVLGVKSIPDVDLNGRDDPARSLFTLSVVTGLVMVAAGLLRLGSFLRFVSNSVMTGFVTAVGINIVLGQLNDFSGYQASGSNRVARAFDLLFHLDRADPATVIVGSVTIVLIVLPATHSSRATRIGGRGVRRLGGCAVFQRSTTTSYSSETSPTCRTRSRSSSCRSSPRSPPC